MINYTPMRIIFEIGDIKIFTWGIMILLAFLISFFLFSKRAKQQKISKEHIYGLLFFTLIGTIVGSRLMYIILNFNQFYINPVSIFSVGEGGFISYGGLIGAITLAKIYTIKSNLKLITLLNIAAPYIALGFAIGRLGCFLNWCCYGVLSNLPWAIKVGIDIPRHPTQIYLSLISFIIFFTLIKVKNSKKKIFSENSFLWFLVFYAMANFLIDFIRVYPPSQSLSVLYFSQIIELIIFLTSVILLIRKSLNKSERIKNNERSEFIGL